VEVAGGVSAENHDSPAVKNHTALNELKFNGLRMNKGIFNVDSINPVWKNATWPHAALECLRPGFFLNYVPYRWVANERFRVSSVVRCLLYPLFN
jgi:hypothetical protein